METAGTHEVARPDTGELMIVPKWWAVYESAAVNFRTNALIFTRVLEEEDYRMICSGLTKFSEGRQWFWSDFWRELALRGYEWPHYIPDSIDPDTAKTWRKVGDKFLPDDRVYGRLLFSHYAATRALPDVEAHKILEAANEGGWTVKAVEEAVKLLKGDPPKTPKPKVAQCKHCDNWIAETDKGCPECRNAVLEKRIESFQAVLTNILGIMAETPEDFVLQVSMMADMALAEV